MIKTSQLANGLKIAVDEMPTMNSASVGLFIGVGGRFERAEEWGMSHFLEHIVFKGTAHRTCQQIKEEIEGIGGNLNAFTAKEYTCFYAKVLGQDYQTAIDVLGDMVIHPLFAPSDIEQEKGVIVEEIKMYRDLPSYEVHDVLDDLVWPEHPLGASLTGSEKIVKKFKQDDFDRFQKRCYKPNNMVLVVAGKVKAKAVIDYAESLFGHLKRGKKLTYKKFKSQQSTQKALVRSRKCEQTHVAIACHAYPRQHKHHYTMGLLSIILGGNMSSRLFKEVREERGLAYDIRSSIYRYADTGVFEISAGTEANSWLDCIEVIMQELDRIARHQVGLNEFKRAQKYYLGNIQINQEKTSERMFMLGEDQICLGRHRTMQEVVKHIKAVSIDDIQHLAKAIFKNKNLNLAVVGPVRKTAKLDRIFSL